MSETIIELILVLIPLILFIGCIVVIIWYHPKIKIKHVITKNEKFRLQLLLILINILIEKRYNIKLIKKSYKKLLNKKV